MLSYCILIEFSKQTNLGSKKSLVIFFFKRSIISLLRPEPIILSTNVYLEGRSRPSLSRRVHAQKYI